MNLEVHIDFKVSFYSLKLAEEILTFILILKIKCNICDFQDDK